jgi:hypothetical protein
MPGRGAFKRCVSKVRARGGAYDPRAVCAAAGRKKYGAAAFAKMSAAGRRRAVRSNPGEIELDSKTAALQYKRLIEMEGAKNIRISRRGRKHVVRWNPLGVAEALTLAQPVLDRAGKKLHFNRPKNKKRIPKKVLEGHRRIWGGKIPPGAMEALRREYVGSGPVRKNRRKSGSIRKNSGYTIRKTPDGDYALRLRGELLGVYANRQTAEKYQRIEQQARKNPGRRNPVETAREKYEEFHGRPSEELIEVDTPMHVHNVLSGVGTLEKLVITTTNGRYKVTLKGFKGTLVAQNEDSAKYPQLYFEGGDQAVDLAEFGIHEPYHEMEELGRLEWIYYYTVKDHLGDDGGEAIYKHRLAKKVRGGAGGGQKPVVLYDVRNKLLSIAGGSYTILPEGIEN